MPTNISWASETLGVIVAVNKETGERGWHCERVSPGCGGGCASPEYSELVRIGERSEEDRGGCYAEAMNEARRFNRGTGLPYSRASRDKVDIFLDEQALIKPLRWKQPRIIFQNSMTDTFAEFVKDEWRDKILAVAGLTPRHHYLLLTKRAREMTRYIQSLDVHQYHSTMYGIPDLGKRHLSERLVEMRFGRTVDTWRMFAVDAFVLGFPIRNVSLGFSAENQECFDKRYREVAPLIEAGWKIWCSFEPLLGPIRIPNERKLSYSVIGGDSGVGFRAMKVEWLIRLAAQLQAAGVPIHIKQDSGLYPGQQGRIPNELWKLKASVK